MNEYIVPSGLLDIFQKVHEPADRVLAILSEGWTAPDLPISANLITPTEFSGTESLPPHEAVFCLDVFAGRPTEEVSPLVQRLGTVVRPGGLLFLTAWSVDHSLWKTPEPGWERSGSRELHHPVSGAHRFFLYDDEIITIFAAWNVLHHHESEDGLIEAVMIKPEGRLVDVSTALYEG